jgi:hypothetical protein
MECVQISGEFMNVKLLGLIFIVQLFALVGCSMLQRSGQSGYSNGGSSKSGWTKVDKVEPRITHPAEDPNTPAKTKIRFLENKISTKKEIEQYSKALPWFHTDEERIEFLSLNGFEERQTWMLQNKFMDRPSTVGKQLAEIIDAQDIALGMPESLVKKSWGEPETVDVSGNPMFKNERWRYQKMVSTPDGFKKETKMVYFEGGKVVGWELE